MALGQAVAQPRFENPGEVLGDRGQHPDRDAVADRVGYLTNQPERPVVVGDSAYADGVTRQKMTDEGFEVRSKCPPVRNSTGGYTKDHFDIDLEAGAGHLPGRAHRPHPLHPSWGGQGQLQTPLRPLPPPRPLHPVPAGPDRSPSTPKNRCSKRARAEQKTAEWQAAYRADRPIVERKIAHFVRRPWGGRRARTRGRQRVNTDPHLRAAALNWARLATLGLHHNGTNWALS